MRVVAGRECWDGCLSRGYTSESLAGIVENWFVLGHGVAGLLESLGKGLDGV